MKTIKTIVALAILFGCSATANAQLGGLVKKVKKAAAEKVESSVRDAKKEAKSGVEQKAKETAGLENLPMTLTESTSLARKHLLQTLRLVMKP